MNIKLVKPLNNIIDKNIHLERIKKSIKPIFKDVINKTEFKLVNSKKLNKKTLDLNFSNISLANYYSVMDRYNKNIDSLRKNILSYFIPNIITKEIFENYIFYKYFQFIYKDKKIYFHLFTKNSQIDFREIFVLICKALTFLVYSKTPRNDILFYYIPTEFKKKSPINDVYGPINVNSAFTSFNMDTSGQRIVVFRKEEAMKVFLHEIVHYVNIDFVHSSQAEIKKLVYRDFSIQENNRFVNLFEAFTDFTAIIYNSIFNSILLDKNVYAIVKDEIKYQKRVLENILDKSGLDHIVQKKNNTGNVLYQKSNILSYYFIKYGLFLKLNIMLKKFNINIRWSENKIREIYKLAYNALVNEKFNSIGAQNNFSMRMTYNNIICL